MKTSSLMAGLGLAFVLAACANSPGPSANQQGQAQKQNTGGTPVIGAEGIPQPEWVRNIPEDPDIMYFVGEGRTGSTVTARKNSAGQDASRQLGIWKESIIKAAIKDYVQEAGETGNTQSLEFLEVASIQRARANTSGLRLKESWIAPDNSFVGLWTYPKADLKQDFKTEVNNFQRKESAAFAEFKANEALRMLDEQLE